MAFNFRRFLPDPENVRQRPALRWLAPFFSDPRLWHVNRRGIAMGIALGVFFGLMIPIAQIPAAVIAALVLRANLPAAVVSTLITNPVTVAPVYYAAYHLGMWLLGRKEASDAEAQLAAAAEQASTGLSLWLDKLASMGLPLAVGLSTLALTLSVSLYFIVHWIWRARTRRAWRRRQNLRQQR